MRKFIRLAGIIAGATATIIGAATPAFASPEPSGFDNAPDVVVGGGSDTTYLVSQRLELLYNGDPGCVVNTSSSSTSKGKCLTPTDTTPANGNFDHDVFVSAQPTGSGAGINALLSTGAAYNPVIDYARSSRGPSGTETNELTFWGYARDAIAVVTFGGRTGVSLTKQQLKDIYACNTTDWSQLGLAAGTIVPWDMNSSSGTYSVFKAYLDNISFGPCVRKLSTGSAPFENDVKPLIADATASDISNSIWWMSYGNWSKYPYTKNAGGVNSQLVTVDGTLPSAATITGNSYAILRTLYHVTRNSDADIAASGTGPSVIGGDSGKSGAVRQFTEWLCRSSNTQHAVNPVTGQGYRSAIIDAISAEGFQPVPSALRTSGYACTVVS